MWHYVLLTHGWRYHGRQLTKTVSKYAYFSTREYLGQLVWNDFCSCFRLLFLLYFTLWLKYKMKQNIVLFQFHFICKELIMCPHSQKLEKLTGKSWLDMWQISETHKLSDTQTDRQTEQKQRTSSKPMLLSCSTSLSSSGSRTGPTHITWPTNNLFNILCIYIIIIGQSDCLSVSRAWSAIVGTQARKAQYTGHNHASRDCGLSCDSVVFIATHNGV